MRRVMPMSVWGIAALYGFVFISSFDCVAMQLKLPTLAAFWSFNQDRVDRYAALVADHPDDLKLVILGNSTIKYATDIDHDTMMFPGVDHVRVLRIVNNWANFSDFEPFTDDILDLQPDLILFQPDLLGRERVLERISKSALLQDYLKWRLAGHGDWNPEKIDQAELQTGQVDYNDQSDARFERRICSLTEWQIINLGGRNAKLAANFLERALSRRIHVVLHYTPVTERAAHLRQRMASQVAPVVERFAHNPGVTLLQFPKRLPQTYFCDFVHMNQKGRSAYMSWLVPELLAIAGRSGRLTTEPVCYNAMYLNSAGGAKLQK